MGNRLGKIGFAIGLILAGMVWITGCAAPVTSTPATPQEQTPPGAAVNSPATTPATIPETTPPAVPPTVAAQAAAFPMVITDQLGRTVTIKKLPQRIISLAPSNTEILYALGLGPKIVGVTDYDNYPADAKNKPSVGGYSTANWEKVVAGSPDLVLAGDIHKNTVIPILEEMGYTVVAFNPKTLDQVLESISLTGKVTGAQDEAATLVASLSARIKAITDKTDKLTAAQRPKVFYTVWYQPLMSAGNGTFQADLIQKAGGANVAQSLNGWAQIGVENVIAANPDIMIAGDMSAGGLNFQFINTEPSLANTVARKSGHVFVMNSDVASRPAPRIVDALEQFARFIHPELFGVNK